MLIKLQKTLLHPKSEMVWVTLLSFSCAGLMISILSTNRAVWIPISAIAIAVFTTGLVLREEP